MKSILSYIIPCSHIILLCAPLESQVFEDFSQLAHGLDKSAKGISLFLLLGSLPQEQDLLDRDLLSLTGDEFIHFYYQLSSFLIDIESHSWRPRFTRRMRSQTIDAILNLLILFFGMSCVLLCVAKTM